MYGTVRDDARIDLEDVDHVVFDRVLHVHQADDLQRARDAPRVVADRAEVPLRDHERRHDAGAVARVDAGLLDVLHDAADDDRARRVGDRIDVELEGVLEEAVDEHRPIVRHVDRARHVPIERARVEHDRHAAAAEHVGGTHDDRDTRSRSATSRASSRETAVPLAGCGMPRSQSSCEKRCRSSARSIESGEVPRIVHARFLQRQRELQRRLPAELHDARHLAAARSARGR